MLLNPRIQTYDYLDSASKEFMLKTIAFFENKGKRKLKEDDHERVWNYDFVMTLTPDGDAYRAGGSKYYIGNANEAALVSTFGKEADSGNKYRLIATIHFNRYNVYIRHVMTHPEYDQGAWKK